MGVLLVTVSLCPASGEPEARPWRAERLAVVVATVIWPVSYRPPRWDERQRPGAIEVPADCPLLIIEGVGAARRESAHLTDAAIWVQADERRSLARVGQPGGPLTVQHLRDWMAEEIPFLAGQRPWERAGLLACGTPQIPFDPATELVVAPPLARSCGPCRSTS